jgi:hypothetical protein
MQEMFFPFVKGLLLEVVNGTKVGFFFFFGIHQDLVHDFCSMTINPGEWVCFFLQGFWFPI